MTQEKLLMLGGSTGTREVLQYAREIGVTTIVADYLPAPKNPAKQLADEAWDMDAADLDALETACRKKHVTAVFAATSEFCLDQAKALCARLGLPFYASEEGWRCARDKERFKQVCIRCGAAVPKQFFVDEEVRKSDLDDIRFPVIIKPVDSSAQQGLSVCHTPEELVKGCRKAREISHSGRILVEEYLTGTEVGIFFFLQEGKLVITATTESLPFVVNGRTNFGFGLHRSQFHEDVIRQEQRHLEDIMRDMNCRNGVGFVQTIRRDGVYHYLEFGYRLDSIASWTFARRFCGRTTLELMTELALGHSLALDLTRDADPEVDASVSGAYPIWVNAGKIVRIEGLDEIKAMNGVTVFLENYHAGDTVLAVDNMRQIALSILIGAPSYAEIGRVIDRINRTLRIVGEDGENMAMAYTGFDDYFSA